MSGPYPGNIDQTSNTLGYWLRQAQRILLDGDTDKALAWAATALGFAADAADREEKRVDERIKDIWAKVAEMTPAVGVIFGPDPNEPAPSSRACWCGHPNHPDVDYHDEEYF